MATWSAWQQIGNVSGNGRPAIARNEDGRLEAFVIDAHGALWHGREKRPGGEWAPWENLNPKRNKVPSGQYGPCIATNADGRLEAFVCENGHVAHRWQNSPSCGAGWDWSPYVDEIAMDSVQAYADVVHCFPVDNFDDWPPSLPATFSHAGWSDWENFEPIDALAAPVVACNPDGRLEIFVRAVQGNCHKWQLTTSFSRRVTGRRISWNSGWAPMPGAVDSVVYRRDGSLELLGWDGNGLGRTVRDAQGQWENAGYVMLSNQPYALTALVANGVGGLDAFLPEYSSMGRGIYQRALTRAADGTWTSDYPQLPRKIADAAPEVVVARNADGRLELYTFTTKEGPGLHGAKIAICESTQVQQTSPGGPWGTPDVSDVRFTSAPRAIVKARTQDGRLVMFGRAADDDGILFRTQLPWDCTWD